MSFTTHPPERVAWLRAYYGGLDALALLTEDDRNDFAALLRGARTRLVRLPNGLPTLPAQRADPTRKIVVAAGRLTRQKGFDLLLPAFAEVVQRHPEWQLRIFGSGPERDALQRQIHVLGLDDAVRLMGRARDMSSEMAQASVYVLSSRFEGFPMVLVEALGAGLPVVAFDCPRGPADLVDHGVNGLLVPDQDVDGLAAGLDQVMGDEELRLRMSVAARRAAEDYRLDRQLGQRWRSLLQDLAGRRSPRRTASLT